MVNRLGNPLQFILSGGQLHDSKVTISLLSEIEISESNILADQAYGTDQIRMLFRKTMLIIQFLRKATALNLGIVIIGDIKEKHLVKCFLIKSKLLGVLLLVMIS